MGDATLLTFGETLGLVVASGIGTLDMVPGGTFGIGGAESNVAVAAARLGADVTWVGRVGEDAFGRLIERRLGAEPMTVRAIRDAAAPTGLMLRWRRTGAGVHVDYHRRASAGSRLCPDDLPDDLVRTAAVLHCTGITPALSDTARAATFSAVATARDAGVTVSVDVNNRRKLWSDEVARPVLRELVAQADILFAGVDEAQLVLDDATEDVERLARGLAALGPREVVLKRGADGCAALVDGALLHEPAVPTVVVDPVGAGDAFVAGYLAGLLAGADVPERLRTAAAVGAWAVSVPGDCELLPTREELRAAARSPDVVR